MTVKFALYENHKVEKDNGVSVEVTLKVEISHVNFMGDRRFDSSGSKQYGGRFKQSRTQDSCLWWPAS